MTVPQNSKKAPRCPPKGPRRSRQGCVNCKLRKVKCDETKPTCKRCTGYDVFCTYDKTQSSNLQLSAHGATNFQLVHVKNALPSLNIITLSPISPLTMPISSKFLKHDDLELLSKFQTRTVFTITFDKSLPIYQNEVIKLACAAPYLMHALLALTLMHTRSLSPDPHTLQSATEASHWSQSITLFTRALSSPQDRDALWATAALLGVMAFGFIDATTAEDTWPLAPPSSLDLNWLKLSDGKKAVWDIVEPLREDCVFQPLALEFASFLPVPKGPGLDVLPWRLCVLCGLDVDGGSGVENAYLDIAAMLAKSWVVECEYTAVTNFFAFVKGMGPWFKGLLERKDARALLLLAYFFAQVCRYEYWWLRRTMLECRAICIYLERNYQHDAEIQALLEYPKMVCRISDG